MAILLIFFTQLWIWNAAITPDGGSINVLPYEGLESKFVKQLILSKGNLRKVEKNRQYIIQVDVLVNNLSPNKIDKLLEKFENIPVKYRNHYKYKDVLNYIEAKIVLRKIVQENYFWTPSWELREKIQNIEENKTISYDDRIKLFDNLKNDTSSYADFILVNHAIFTAEILKLWTYKDISKNNALMDRLEVTMEQAQSFEDVVVFLAQYASREWFDTFVKFVYDSTQDTSDIEYLYEYRYIYFPDEK